MSQGVTSACCYGRPDPASVGRQASGPADIRVQLALAAEAAFRAMAGDEDRLVAHGPQTLHDGVDQLLMVALGEVRAAYAAGKQHIADKGAVDLRRVEDHMAGRVAGAVAHVQRFLADGHGVAVMQPARGHKGVGVGKAEHGALLGQAVDPELVAFMRADDGQGVLGRELAGASGMVDMGVGDPDGLEIQAQALRLPLDLLDITTGVDDGRIHGLVAPDERAVLLKGGDGDGVILQHG